MLVDCISMRGTPTFEIKQGSFSLKRAYGAIYDQVADRWLFPAYAPLGLAVIKDLRVVVPDLRLTPAAAAQEEFLRGLDARIAARELPATTYTTTPMAHQLEGLCKLFYFHRYALFWEAGVGKTKPVVDLLGLLKGTRALVITQRAVVNNWVNEVARHSGGALRAVGLTGSNGAKRKTIAAYKNYDVIVASYGTARTLGTGGLTPSTMDSLRALLLAKAITKASLKDLAKSLRRISDGTLQKSLVARFVSGELSLGEVEALVNEECRTSAQRLSDIDYQIIVADESHYIKEITSLQTKSVLALSAKAQRRYLLTGTPSQGDPRHFYTLLRFLSPALAPENFWEFSEKFLVRSSRNKHIILSYKNLNILNERVTKVSHRLTKAECLDLPERTIVDVHVTLSDEQKRLYNTLRTNMELDVSSFFPDQESPVGMMAVQNAATLLNKLSQVSSGFLYDTPSKSGLCTGCDFLSECVALKIHPYTKRCKLAQTPPPQSLKRTSANPKLEALSELLDTVLVNEKAKVIVWACFTPELDDICAMLAKKKIRHVRVDGSNSENAQDMLKEFSEPDCRVYVAQIVTGIGITINQATYMVYYSVDWSLDHYDQSKDRNYRVGQTEKVTVYRLIATNTVDQFKILALDLKQNMSTMLVSRMACTHCAKASECLKNGIKLFDTGCIYKTTMKKKTVKVEEV